MTASVMQKFLTCRPWNSWDYSSLCTQRLCEPVSQSFMSLTCHELQAWINNLHTVICAHVIWFHRNFNQRVWKIMHSRFVGSICFSLFWTWPRLRLRRICFLQTSETAAETVGCMLKQHESEANDWHEMKTAQTRNHDLHLWPQLQQVSSMFKALPTNATVPPWVDAITCMEGSRLATALENAWGLVVDQVKDLGLGVLPHSESFRCSWWFKSLASSVFKRSICLFCLWNITARRLCASIIDFSFTIFRYDLR